MLTGESVPVSKENGATVIGGSINAEGSLVVEVKKTGEDSFLAKVIGMVKAAQESKSKTQDLANRAALWLTVIAIVCGVFTFLLWVVLSSQGVAFALERTVTVMVITCPHALGLAVPLVVAVSTSLAANQGLLIRNRSAFENARKIQAVIFDKTGTLTRGQFGITDVLVFKEAKYHEDELIEYAAAVEVHSEHPIAKAIALKGVKKKKAEKFTSLPGKGAEGVVEGKRVSIVSPAMMQIKETRIADLSAQGKTVVLILIDGQLQGAIALADMVRAESKEAIAKLKKMGIRCLMLTGDNQRVGKWVADTLQLDEYFAEVLPEEKAQKVTEVQARNLVVAMIGDGVNDAPALAQADVGIAIGAGTDIAMEAADIILVKSNPLDAVAVLSLARRTYDKMVQNLFWATGYNAIAIPLAAGILYPFGILLSPALGAVLMSLSTVICAVNAKLLRDC
jgi:Cu2+-exporting ATPase